MKRSFGRLSQNWLCRLSVVTDRGLWCGKVSAAVAAWISRSKPSVKACRQPLDATA